jgi:hypothetical protein
MCYLQKFHPTLLQELGLSHLYAGRNETLSTFIVVEVAVEAEGT